MVTPVASGNSLKSCSPVSSCTISFEVRSALFAVRGGSCLLRRKFSVTENLMLMGVTVEQVIKVPAKHHR